MIDLSKAYIKRNILNEVHTHKGFDAFTHSAFGRLKSFYPYQRKLLEQSERIATLSLSFQKLDDEAFDKMLQTHKNQARLGKLCSDEAVLETALALICEASFRVLGIRPYTVQILGALALFGNFVIQMHTGEGKTITATLTAILNGWLGKPCHIVTSNDYLAKRDADSMRELYERCYLTVGCITPEMENPERKANYLCNIVYATSNDILADFLRDQMARDDAIAYDKYLINALSSEDDESQVMRGLHTVIIDEADSVLADEATTPLIISVPIENKPLKDAIQTVQKIAKKLNEDEDYTLNANHKEVYFTKQGEKSIDDITQHLPAIWQSKNRREYLLKQALIAKEFYKKGNHYVILEDKIVIVDEKTGRLMPSRSWGGGLHQAVEAKESLELTDPTQTHIKMSFQRFFRLYRTVAGMSGTLQKLENELWHIYELTTMKIPKRVPNQYKIFPEKIFESKAQKWIAVIEEIEAIHELKRPILVGTRSISDSEALSNELKRLNIVHTVLHALHHKEEAEIIAKAGQKGSVIIATNIAGRGTDISLSKVSIDMGGLHVIATERHDSKRVDMQLFGRCARQGQPGSVQAILSLEDEIMMRKCPKWLREKFTKHIDSALWRKISIYTYIIIQNLTDKRQSKVRKGILAKDFSMSRALSFSEK